MSGNAALFTDAGSLPELIPASNVVTSDRCWDTLTPTCCFIMLDVSKCSQLFACSGCFKAAQRYSQVQKSLKVPFTQLEQSLLQGTQSSGNWFG